MSRAIGRPSNESASEILDDFVSGVGADGVVFMEGVFHVRSEHGHTYESVKIRVEYPHSFPERGQTPTVVLLSHRDRWPKGGDSHLNSDWSMCLFVPGESGIEFQRADSLRQNVRRDPHISLQGTLVSASSRTAGRNRRESGLAW